MQKYVEAVYEEGVFKPLKPVDIPEHKRIILLVEDEAEETSDIISLASKVFGGLSLRDVEEIETIALDRNNFSRD